MKKEEDILLKKVKENAAKQNEQAASHKHLYRNLWILSALISLLVALFTSFEFDVYKISSITVTSSNLATGLALILPVVTGYVVLRSPEKLWVFEVDTRNQLYDLATELEFLMDRGKKFDREEYEKRFLKIMKDANEKWVSIKSA